MIDSFDSILLDSVFCFKCKEKLKKYQMGWASTYTHILIWFNLDIRRFFPLIRVLLLFHHSMRCFLFDVVYNKVAFEVGMLWTIVIDFEKNMHGGMASQLKLLQITSGTVRLHFFLDLWHPCPCRDAAVTTMMITMKGTMDTAMATTKTLQWPGLWLWQPRWQPPWRWLLYSRLQWLWHALRFTMWHLVVNFQACFLVLLILDHSCCW